MGGNFSIHKVLFDLVGTLVYETSSSGVLNTEQGYYEIQAKAIHDSLEMDGILADWSLFRSHYERVRRMEKERSKLTLEEYDMCKGISDVLSFFKYEIPPESEVITRAVNAYMDIYINSLKINVSAYDILKRLTVEYELGLVTNFAYPPGACRILDRFSLKSFFRVIVISGEVGWKKPSQQIFSIALSRLNANPEETLFVGDDYEADIVGAKRLGMRTVFLGKEPLNNEDIDITIESLDQLLFAIKQFSPRANT